MDYLMKSDWAMLRFPVFPQLPRQNVSEFPSVKAR